MDDVRQRVDAALLICAMSARRLPTDTARVQVPEDVARAIPDRFVVESLDEPPRGGCLPPAVSWFVELGILARYAVGDPFPEPDEVTPA